MYTILSYTLKIHRIKTGSHLMGSTRTPSRLHSTTTEEEGRGVTRQGSTTRWPISPSTEEGSDLSILTPAGVQLEQWRANARDVHKRKKERKTTVITLCCTIGNSKACAVTTASIKISLNLATPEPKRTTPTQQHRTGVMGHNSQRSSDKKNKNIISGETVKHVAKPTITNVFYSWCV